MTVRYIISRIGAQLGVLFLGIVLYSLWLEHDGRVTEQTNLNALMYTFLAASLPPIWWRGIALKGRVVALVVGAIIAMPVGTIYFAVIDGAPYASPELVAIFQSGLVAIGGPAVGWFASSRTIRWLAKRTVAPTTGDQPSSAVAVKEVIAFRFLLLTWGAGLLIFGFAAFALIQAAAEQRTLKYFSQEIIACQQRIYDSCHPEDSDEARSTCDQRARFCADATVPGYAQGVDGAAQMRDLWNDRAENAVYLGIAVVVLSSLLFYGIRWRLTGRVRPLWPLRRRG